jgi:carboxyl-terminal processing protease
MTSRTRWLVVAVSTPLVLFVVVGSLLGAAPREPQQGPVEIAQFRDVLSLIMQGYVEKVDIERVMDGAMRGLADSLDSSSAYLTPPEVKALEAKVPLPAGDTGLIITRQFYLRIVGVRDGSPAAKAGLLTGDFIRMIDGKPTRDMSAFAGTRLLRGAPGSKVTLTVIRSNPTDPHEFTLVRTVPVTTPADLVAVAPINGKSVAGAEAHVRVSSFDAGAAAALRQTFATLQKDGARGAVIDLRNASDGPLDEGVAAARLFIKSGTIAIKAGRAPEKTAITAGPGDGAVTMPVVLLISNGTANAAEVFAAALAGNNRAELVGEPTAGLAAEQKLVLLPVSPAESHGLWLTYARYMHVDGKQPIHERGVRPTVGVEIPTPGFDELPPATDQPLAKAVEQLRVKLGK